MPHYKVVQEMTVSMQVKKHDMYSASCQKTVSFLVPSNVGLNGHKSTMNVSGKTFIV
jgi:archaellum biogenesis ATPase FlaH